jgi:hypothetical protein
MSNPERKLVEIPNYKNMGNLFVTVMWHNKKYVCTYTHINGRSCGGIGDSEEEATAKLLEVIDEIYGEKV